MDKKINSILNQYRDKEITNYDRLISLDKMVKQPAIIFAYIFGVIGALVMGFGMCLAMQVIFPSTINMIIGIVVGLVGIAMVSVNFFIYRAILDSRRAKYKSQILSLSEQL